MNELKLINLNGVEVVESRQVAEAIGKEHKELLRDIRKYSGFLNESKIALVDFFIESTYIDSKGEERPCYLCTKKGCEMIANKLTGKRGVTFTAMYVNAFHDMKNKLNETERLYGMKSTSVGEVASLIKVLRCVMKDQKSNPQKIAVMAKSICEQFNVELPENFVEKNPFENQLFLLGFKMT